jgi:hypothetical protein
MPAGHGGRRRADFGGHAHMDDHQPIELSAQVSFYSQTRAHEWPGGGQSWDLFDHRPHTFTLSCVSGEKICYGAFVYKTHSRYWGVGYDNSFSCSDCCGFCGAGSMANALGQ